MHNNLTKEPMMIKSIEDGRKEDGMRSIAEKIIKRLHDLNKSVENNQGRWAWELLQNAKDSVAEDDDRTVSICIELNQEGVEFKHNGTHFTELDIRGLINQISSKEMEEGQQTKKTGRFGTGFLTTHLLSKQVKIQGIVETKSDGLCSFDFLLDRQAKLTKELIPKIESAWQQFEKSAQIIGNSYDKNEFNTSFYYLLESEAQKEIAKIGVDEFSKLIPFVLAFIPKIDSVTIIDRRINKNTVFKNNRESTDNFIIPIQVNQNGEQSEILILRSTSTDQKVSIATLIEKQEKGYSVKSINDVPKIFCDFPLIGTEDFHFPVIVNSFFFNPQTERDGIWLKSSTDDLEVKENQGILENAVELYRNLICHLAERNFIDLYNFVETRIPSVNESYFDTNWYKQKIQIPIREIVFHANIVELESNHSERRSINELKFPLKSYSESIQSTIWQFILDLSPHDVCKKEHLYHWCEHSWEKWNLVDYPFLVNFLAKEGSINRLSMYFGGSEDRAIEWLNALCEFILDDESNIILFNKNKITPNQNNFFIKKEEIYIDHVEDEELVNILGLLGEDWRNSLLHKRIRFGSYYPKSKKDIANRITEKMAGLSKDDSFKEAVSLLSEWFDNNPKSGKELFLDLYNKRAELFMNTIEDKENLYNIMRSRVPLSQISALSQSLMDNPKLIQQVSELGSLLTDLNVSEVSELRAILESAQRTNPPITINQETLLSLGVTSVEELAEALRDVRVAAQFIHTSTPTDEMFQYVHNLIERSKKNVIAYLKTLSDYDCSEYEELATTVIGGIKKQELPIHVVVRPSDNQQVIIYYSSEKDTLDYENAELWIDNGKDTPRHLTLGKILKNTGINRIPV